MEMILLLILGYRIIVQVLIDKAYRGITAIYGMLESIIINNQK